MRKVVLMARSSKDTPLREIMTTSVIHVRPDQTSEECMALMTQNRVRHLPVINDGRLSGLISISDLVKASARSRKSSSSSCNSTFASLGTAMGLGILAGYEGLFINTRLPLFAAIALIANAFGWLRHRRWHRSVLGMIGPAMVLAAMLLFFGQWWTAELLYTGLAFMVGVSLWDLLSPANKRCSPTGYETRQVRP